MTLFQMLKIFTCSDDEVVRKTILREVKILRMLKQDNIVNLKEGASVLQVLLYLLMLMLFFVTIRSF